MAGFESARWDFMMEENKSRHKKACEPEEDILGSLNCGALFAAHACERFHLHVVERWTQDFRARMIFGAFALYAASTSRIAMRDVRTSSHSLSQLDSWVVKNASTSRRYLGLQDGPRSV
jgi:hypothetical protein